MCLWKNKKPFQGCLRVKGRFLNEEHDNLPVSLRKQRVGTKDLTPDKTAMWGAFEIEHGVQWNAEFYFCALKAVNCWVLLAWSIVKSLLLQHFLCLVISASSSLVASFQGEKEFTHRVGANFQNVLYPEFYQSEEIIFLLGSLARLSYEFGRTVLTAAQ